LTNSFPIPDREEERVAELEEYQILDTVPEAAFDEITELAAEILQCPASFIEFMDGDRQWFKSKYGLPDDYTETPRDIAVCSHTICQSDLLCVPDLSQDERFADNPLVSSAPNVRFYAGMPLITPTGHAIGTLCTVDFEKRELSINQQEALRRLSRQVVTQLELRRALLEMNDAIKTRDEMYEELQSERDKTDNLMEKILPKSIAEEIKHNGKVSPRYFDEASILFSDIVGFTKLTEALPPNTLVELLDQIFCRFDTIAAKHGVEKIKTIGDAYMCVSGTNNDKEGHADKLCAMAIEMRDYMQKSNIQREKLKMPRWDIRIGIHSGPVISGVVGENKFTFDIWGDAVNIASLMEQNSEPGRINISETTQYRVNQKFELTDRGKIASSKKGNMAMFFLENFKSD
tara:strand:+ start:841 stop:2049 length:1209 start_codon:yes stop_codon:yes gene_type:complete